MSVELATAYVTLLTDGSGITKEVNRRFGQVQKSADRHGRAAGRRMGAGVAAGIGRMAGPIAAAFGGAAIVKGIMSTVGRASDLNETVNKSAVIFGKSRGEIEKWASTAATKLGLSKQQALESAAGFGDMFLQMGMSGKQATKMSKSIIQLSTDLGSFNNLPTADVNEMISASFRGEYDSLQRIVPTINAAAVEQKALAMTGKKSAKQLTAQEKAMATYAIISKSAKRATGDFAKTSGETANMQKIVAAQWEDLQAKMGQKFLPVAKKVMGWVSTQGIPTLDKFSTWFSASIGPALSKATGLFQTSKPAIDGFASTLRSASGAGSWLQTTFLPAVRGIGAALSGMWAVARPILMQLGNALRSELQARMPQIKAAFEDGKATIVAVMGIIQRAIQIATVVIKAIWSRWGGDITRIVRSTFGGLITIIGGIIRVIRGVVTFWLGVISGDWRKSLSGIKTIVSGFGKILGGAWRVIFNQLPGPVRRALTTIKNAFSSAWSAIKRGASGFGTSMGKAMSSVGSKVAGGVNTVIGILNKLIGAYNKVANAVGGKTIGSIQRVGVSASRRSTAGGAFAEGGWTGPGGKWTPAGIVHADEYVIKKSSRQRIERTTPGLLDYLNKYGILPGHAAGGLVSYKGGTFTAKFARVLASVAKKIGFSLYQGGFRPATSYSGTSHAGDAIDVGPVSARLVRTLRSAGIAAWDRTGMGNWMPHIHGVPLPGVGRAGGSGVWQAQDYLRGGNGLGGADNGAGSGFRPKGGFGSSIVDVFKQLRDALGKVSLSVGSSPFANMLESMAGKAKASLINYGKAKLSPFDSGGILQPGLTLAYNGTGKPETVRTYEQERALHSPAVFHLYDADGVLMGTMRGVAAQDAAYGRRLARAGVR